MSAFNPKADFREREWNVRYVPEADMPLSIASASEASRSLIGGIERPDVRGSIGKGAGSFSAKLYF